MIKGVMVESYLEEGRQNIGPDMVYGKSITDPCIGWEDTEHLIYKNTKERRPGKCHSVRSYANYAKNLI